MAHPILGAFCIALGALGARYTKTKRFRCHIQTGPQAIVIAVRLNPAAVHPSRLLQANGADQTFAHVSLPQLRVDLRHLSLKRHLGLKYAAETSRRLH